MLKADLAKPGFDGDIKYDADDDGNVVSGDIKVFAAGRRNPYGVIMHSNGKLYGTDNGPNYGYGDTLIGCDGQTGADVEEEDKLNLLEEGNVRIRFRSRRALPHVTSLPVVLWSPEQEARRNRRATVRFSKSK